MKFDKQTADHIVGELAQAKSVLMNQQLLGLRIEADQATIDALSQSTHPDVNEVVGNISVRPDFIYIDGMADVEDIPLMMALAKIQGRSEEFLRIEY